MSGAISLSMMALCQKIRGFVLDFSPSDDQSVTQGVNSTAAPDQSLTPAQWECQVRACVQACYDHAERYFLRPFPRPEVSFKLRGGHAGVAEPGRQRLRFNRQLLLENGQPFVDEVVPHEVAHLLAYALFGRRIRPHGVEWQSIMRDVLGCIPKTRHGFDVKKAARQSFIYACQCQDREHALTIIRHRRMSQGQVYVCRVCRQPLRFIRQE